MMLSNRNLLFQRCIFRCELLGSRRVCNIQKIHRNHNSYTTHSDAPASMDFFEATKKKIRKDPIPIGNLLVFVEKNNTSHVKSWLVEWALIIRPYFWGGGTLAGVLVDQSWIKGQFHVSLFLKNKMLLLTPSKLNSSPVNMKKIVSSPKRKGSSSNPIAC